MARTQEAQMDLRRVTAKISVSQWHRRRSGSGGPAFAGPMFYANAPPPLRARIVYGHTVRKHGTCRICLTNVHETATPLNGSGLRD